MNTQPRIIIALAAALLLGACGSTTTGGTLTLSATAQPTQAVVLSQDLPPAAPSGAPEVASSASGLSSATGVYTVSDGSAAQTGQSYVASEADQSAVYVTGGALALSDATISKTGDTTSADSSSFYGLNAAVLATNGSQVTVSGGTVTADAAGANGIFATGEGTLVTVNGTRIEAAGDGAHAVMATLGGALALNDVDMVTTDIHSGAVATDRGSGTIAMTGGSVLTSGVDSPAIYSTGAISVNDATLSATGAEAAVIEGANSISLTDSSLTTTAADKWGVMIYQSFSGDAEGSEGVFTMSGGSLAASSGPLFYVTNATGQVSLTGVQVTAASGVLGRAAANDRWGQSGANGGALNLVAERQTLAGDLEADAISTLALTLRDGSALTGAINAAGTAGLATLALDASSSWTVTADSVLTCLDDADGIVGTAVTNIIGNGHTVTYDSAACPALGGKTYSLSGGGMLVPAA